MTNIILPFLFVSLLIYSGFKKIRVYDSFIDGIKNALLLVYSIFPYLATIFIMVNLFRLSGLTSYLIKLLEKPFLFLNIPVELTELILLRPFSGNSSILLLEDIYSKYSPDSYIARTASVIVGSSDTVFYIAALYFSESKVIKLRYGLIVALFANFIGCLAACILCKYF